MSKATSKPQQNEQAEQLFPLRDPVVAALGLQDYLEQAHRLKAERRKKNRPRSPRRGLKRREMP